MKILVPHLKSLPPHYNPYHRRFITAMHSGRPTASPAYFRLGFANDYARSYFAHSTTIFARPSHHHLRLQHKATGSLAYVLP
ncbi:hypothetical protein D0Y65_019690 [Glycine soja]|uniref:Uncharacterized protein n=1 Tax=Glycine soja TaxID=3848 RepID=A0A445JAQ8_GLYSO|nr:hypothetical protein D0Y65_019690 [Glycine soja]